VDELDKHVTRAREPELEMTATRCEAARERGRPELGAQGTGERAGAPVSGDVVEVLDYGGIPTGRQAVGLPLAWLAVAREGFFKQLLPSRVI
jgi:hypothetical protein